MSVHIHPLIAYVAEKGNRDTQGAFSTSNPVNEASRYLEGKPAMLVVTDATDTKLLKLVGVTSWSLEELESSAYALEHHFYRVDDGTDITSASQHEDLLSTRSTCPMVPALRFTPHEQFMSSILATGTAAKAFLLVDTMNTRSATDTASWDDVIGDNATAFDPTNLPADVRYIRLGLGEASSDQPVRLTNLEITLDQSIVQLADGYIQLYFMNLFNDWSNMRAAMDARLAAIPSFGKTLQEIVDKEALAFPA